MSRDEPFRDMEHSTVYDVNRHEIGKIIDFTIDQEYKLKHFIIKGDNELIQGHFGVITYYLLLPPDAIRRSTHDEVFLNCEVKELQPLTEIEPDEHRYLVIRNIEVLAKDGENLGKIVDGLFHSDDHVSFVLGGTSFNRFLSRFGFTTKMQLLVPYRYISRFDHNIIVLNKNRDSLGQVMNDVVLDSDGYRILEARKLASKESRLLLFKESYKDVVRSAENTSY